MSPPNVTSRIDQHSPDIVTFTIKDGDLCAAHGRERIRFTKQYEHVAHPAITEFRTFAIGV